MHCTAVRSASRRLVVVEAPGVRMSDETPQELLDALPATHVSW